MRLKTVIVFTAVVVFRQVVIYYTIEANSSKINDQALNARTSEPNRGHNTLAVSV